MLSAFAAGIVGAIVVDAFFLIVPFANAPPQTPLAFYTVAATAFAGPSAAGAAWAVPLGVTGHLAVGVAWAFGYLQLARSAPQLVRRPWISGLAFGLIVGLVMIGVDLATGTHVPATYQEVDRQLFGYMVFFGPPLALVAARLTPTRA